MATLAIARQRLRQQRLVQSPLANPEDVVIWLGAVQAQEYLGAMWALGLRMKVATSGVIEQAFANGTILRTHVMRPTWHFVAPADIRWLLDLTAPRVKAASAYMCRQHGLDDALLARGNEIIARALQGGRQYTRAELGAALAEAGIIADGVRLGYIIMHAELDAVICSGPRRGNQFTYALLDERAPQARMLSRDEALTALILRYYTSHGPATLKDFVWWSGLTTVDARAGLAAVGSQLSSAVVDGVSYWFSPQLDPDPQPSTEAFLLPTYDEFLVGYSAFDQARSPEQETAQEARQNLVFSATFVLDGRVVGRWKRTLQKKTVQIDIAPFVTLNTTEMAAITAAAHRYGTFLDRPVVCTILENPANVVMAHQDTSLR